MSYCRDFLWQLTITQEFVSNGNVCQFCHVIAATCAFVHQGAEARFYRNQMSCCCCTSAFNKFLGFRHSFQSKTFHWDVSRCILHPPVGYSTSRITGFHWFISSFSAGFLHNSGLHVCQKRAEKCRLTVKTGQKMNWRRIVRFCFISLF